MENEKPIIATVNEVEMKEAAGKKVEPRCPYCKMDPLELSTLDQITEVGDIVIVSRTLLCKGCRAPIPIYKMEMGKKTSALEIPPGSRFQM